MSRDINTDDKSQRLCLIHSSAATCEFATWLPRNVRGAIDDFLVWIFFNYYNFGIFIRHKSYLRQLCKIGNIVL